MDNKYGLIIEKVQPDQYYLGGGFIGTKEINPEGNWEGFLPQVEYQAKKVESMNCTAYGSINALETLINFLYKDVKDYSERYIGILAETTPQGNSPHKVGETIRKSGLVDEIDLPFDDNVDTWEKYYSPKPMTSKYIRKGKKFIEEYEMKHEWVFTGGFVGEKNRLVKEALKRSPVGLSVYAWIQDENGIYYKAGTDNHWTLCYGMDENGNYKIFDSYDCTHKIYSKDADIAMAKLYFIEKKEAGKKVNFMLKLLEIIKNLWSTQKI